MNNKRIAIIDYQMSNLFSVQRACEHENIDAFITSDKKDVLNADAIILPGVGSFGDAMSNLKRLDLISPIQKVILSSKPFLGICLGMQLLFEDSEEFGYHKGLGIIKGSVKRFPDKNNLGENLKVPQVGWNRIDFVKKDANDSEKIFEGIPDKEFMYFVHSYFVDPSDKEVVLTTTNYDTIQFCSSLEKGNIIAMQFHPEKSGTYGLKIYNNFSKIVNNQ